MQALIGVGIAKGVIRMVKQNMKKYKTLTELTTAKALKQHKANLSSGGVFDFKTGKRISNLPLEKRLAKKEVSQVSREYSENIIGIKLSKGATKAKYIKNFGYVEYKTG